MTNIFYELQLKLADITDKIMSYIPYDIFARAILAMIALVIVFGLVNLFYKDIDETK
jgi:hypothetical protein